MRDYTETDFQKKSFIMRYKINDRNLEIEYADGEIQILPYTEHNEIMLLERMKKQVLSYPNFKDNAKLDRVFFRIKKYLCLGGAAFGTVVLANLGVIALSVGLAGVGFVPALTINGLMILVMKKYYDASDDEIIKINDAMRDYDKSMFYIHNEKIFTDERMNRPDVINKTPTRVKKIVTSSPLLDEIPAININSISDLSMKELKSSYEASLQSHGPVKKISRINK